MIALRRIVEQSVQGQYYDLGQDFSNLKRALDGSNETIKQKFERDINSKLSGKKVRARSSRGFKQFEKDYEFDVSSVTIDDYYDNIVVVAHDNTNPKKSREYFLRPGFKIQVIGLSGNPTQDAKGQSIETPKVLASPEQGPPQTKSSVPMKEEAEHYDAYSIESIMDDLKLWLNDLLEDERLGVKGFVKSIGWMAPMKQGKSIAVYDIEIPKEAITANLSDDTIQELLSKVSNNNNQFKLIRFGETKTGYRARIKKVMMEESQDPEGIPRFDKKTDNGTDNI